MKQTFFLLLAVWILAATPAAQAGSGFAITSNVTVDTRSSVSTLSGLALSTGTLSPTFASATISYTASVTNATASITVTPTVTDATATVKVNNALVTSGTASGPIALAVGTNTITTKVTAQDGSTTKTYTVTVTRAPSSVATLSGLVLSSGTLSPAFASETIAYSATVAHATSSITAIPTLTTLTASVTVNGVAVTSGIASAPIPLAVGPNTISTVVTAQDGVTTKTYTVTVTRISNVATLSGLALSSGTLSPVFAPAATSYTASVTNATESITVTPTLTDATAMVKVNDALVTSGAASGLIALAVGTNSITIVVTAQDGTTTKTYTVEVIRTLTLAVGALSNGSITGVAMGGDYLPGATATLTAVPAAGYVFSGWTGDASGNANPLSLLMDANKMIGATFVRDTNDDDDDGLSNYDEAVTYGTNSALKDTDGDGLEDGLEAGLGRFSIIPGSFTWAQARADAHTRGGELACFSTEARWNRAKDSLGAGATDNYTGLWIGATDEGMEGAWTWVNGEVFAYSNWATDRPSAAPGNTLDYAEISGGGGAELDKWYDRTATFIRDAYILEIGYATDPTKADTDGDGIKDGAEITAGTNPIMADTDGDGYQDGAEVQCGSSPLAAASVPEFKIYNVMAQSEGIIQFGFPAQQGVSYSVQGSLDLLDWDDIETNIIGQGAVITRTYSTAGQAKRFFRAGKN